MMEFADLRKLRISPIEFYVAYLEIKSLREEGYYDEVLGDRDNSLVDYLAKKHEIEGTLAGSKKGQTPSSVFVKGFQRGIKE